MATRRLGDCAGVVSGPHGAELSNEAELGERRHVISKACDVVASAAPTRAWTVQRGAAWPTPRCHGTLTPPSLIWQSAKRSPPRRRASSCGSFSS